MKILSLFDGMSVAQQALKNIGADVEVYYASEIDEYAKAVTQANHPNTIQLGSVVGLTLDEQIYLMIGGSPCQDLSIAKKNREGLKGSRSGLFWEYVRIRDEVKPKYFILENVASMPKEAKDTISEALGVQPVMINASLVSAQNRKRLFWVGRWNGEKYEQVEIPQPEDRGILLKDILEENVDEKYFIGKDFQLGNSQGNKVYETNNKSRTLMALGGGGGAKTGLYMVRGSVRQNAGLSDKKAHSLLSSTGLAGRQLLIPKDRAIELRGKYLNKEQDLTNIRKLTPLECLRLQSMPDDYFDKAEYKGKPISNTQRYKMCGNAFNCAVIEHILKHL